MTGQRRHVPLRRCVACRASLPKAQLLRMVRSEAGWRLDVSGRAGGRGTWVCHQCVERLDERPTTRALGRAFRQDAAQVSALLRPLRDARAAADAADHGASRTADHGAHRTKTDQAASAATSDDSRHGGRHG